MSPGTACRGIATAVIVLTVAQPLVAQPGQSIEDFLRSRVAAQPELLAPYFDLASFYYAERRYDDLDRTLNAALKVVRQHIAKAPTAVPPAVAPAVSNMPIRLEPGITPPTRLRETKPIYPPEALQNGVGGTVGMDIVINPHGLVADARVTVSVAGLDDAALAAVRQWEYVPAFRNGAAIPILMSVKMTFIPETFVTVTTSSGRRQVSTVLAAARRFSELGAHGQAETAIDCVLAAAQRERNEPVVTAAATTTGVTTSNWPLRAGCDVKPPARTADAKPVYPAEAQQAGTEGIVTFDFTIDEQGKPTSLRRLGNVVPVLEQAGRDAIEQWRFMPTTVAGTPVPIAMSVTFAFQAKRGVVEDVVPVGGEITEPKKIKHVPPRYPADAQASRTQGVVVIEAIIDRAGIVSNARLVRSGGDALDQAALEAVKQWEFTPTLLYGVPVSVVMTVTVNFTLR